MMNPTVRKIDWLAELVFGFDILIILTLAAALGSVLAGVVGVGSGSTLVWMGTIVLVYGLRYLAFPLGLLIIMFVAFFWHARPVKMKYFSLITGICGTLAGLALWVIVIFEL